MSLGSLIQSSININNIYRHKGEPQRGIKQFLKVALDTMSENSIYGPTSCEAEWPSFKLKWIKMVGWMSWIQNDYKNSCKKHVCITNMKTHRYQCAWILVVCASDLLPATQGHPGSQTSLNYSRVPMQKEQSSRYQTGNTYRNWLDYFSHSSTAAHSTWRLLIGWVAGKPESPHNSNEHLCAVFSCAQTVLQNRVSVNNHCLLFVTERQRETERQTDWQTEGSKVSLTFRLSVLSCPRLLRYWK